MSIKGLVRILNQLPEKREAQSHLKYIRKPQKFRIFQTGLVFQQKYLNFKRKTHKNNKIHLI